MKRGKFIDYSKRTYTITSGGRVIKTFKTKKAAKEYMATHRTRLELQAALYALCDIFR